MGGVLDLGQVKGPQGDPGPKGDPGPQGNPGVQGNPGTPGITPNIQVGTVTTLPPGSDAYFTRQEGSPDAAPVFDVGLPRGADSVNDGDMKAAMYDPTGKEQDIFAYADTKANSAEENAKNHAYSKAQSLSAETAALYGKDETAVPDDILAAIPMIVNAGWKLLQEWTVAGTYTWTAPDLFGGEDYEIGVLVIGAGGSGAAYASGFNSTHLGGASGYSVSFALTVSPGDSFRIVVGAGGPAVITSGGGVNGNNGNSSSFNMVVAEGGDGGRSESYGDYSGGQAPFATMFYDNDIPFGGVLRSSYYNSSRSSDEKIRGCPTCCFNPFEAKRILGAGGLSYFNEKSGKGGKDPVTGLGGGDGAFSKTANATAQSASDSGCGGGAASCSSGKTATSGSGADGAVKLYIRRIAS